MTHLSVHVNNPQPSSVWIERFYCTTCGRPKYGVVVHVEWYGTDATCLYCGERYSEEGRTPRPFERGWREKSKADARKVYRRFKEPSP